MLAAVRMLGCLEPAATPMLTDETNSPLLTLPLLVAIRMQAAVRSGQGGSCDRRSRRC